ncbi:helix-turn-helix transcriptional regulator [Stutzerimonas stutzeri]
MQIIKTQDVCTKISVSRTTLWRLCQTEDFPKPVRLGPGGRSIGFFAHEIDA